MITLFSVLLCCVLFVELSKCKALGHNFVIVGIFVHLVIINLLAFSGIDCLIAQWLLMD